MKLREKLAYIKGLTEGISDGSKESVIYSSMVSFLEDMLNEMEELDKDVAIICDELDAIDEDLDGIDEEIENINDCLDEFIDEEYDDVNEQDCAVCYDDENTGVFVEDENEDKIIGDVYDIICPNCSDEICVDDSILDLGSINCPNCNQNLSFDVDADEFESNE